MSAQELLFVELDLPKCANDFGVAPCTAVGSGDAKCKKTVSTCKDFDNYDGSEIQTLRWVKSASYMPKDIYAVPSLNDVQTNAQRINPGENLGRRERVTCSFFNHRHNDLDLDPYVSERSYNPYEKGTYWGRFDAMYPSLQGYEARIIRGNTDQEISAMETSHYIADVGKIAGDKIGYSLTLKDVLEFAEGNKTLFPAPSLGLLSADLTVGSTATLTPTGIGASYPSSFMASIGNESVDCTRAGDVVTFTARGARGSIVDDHKEGDVLQITEEFDGENVSEILERLLGATNIPLDYYNQAQWDAQVAIVNSPNLTAYVAQPTPVFELMQDLMRDMALDIHADVVEKKIIMRFLINQVPAFEINDRNIIDTPAASYYEDKRVDLFFMAFGRRNPLLKMDDQINYPTTIVRPSSNPVSYLMGNPSAIRRHNSRWIPAILRAQASQTAAFIVGRYEIAPRGLMCKMKADMAPQLAQICTVKSSVFEDAFGNTPSIPMQVVAISKAQGNYAIELEEFRAATFDPDDLDIVIYFAENMLSMGEFASLRELYDSIYPYSIPSGATVRFEADSGVIFGSETTDSDDFALIVGDWPEVAGSGLTLQIANLTIAGRGGDGGTPYSDGGQGGPALYTRVDVELIDCLVGGGAGGGGGKFYFDGSYGFSADGGGGAGYPAGARGSTTATLEIGALGTTSTVSPYPASGDGGDLGDDGYPSYAVSGGAIDKDGGVAGVAVDGISYVTITGTTTIYGTQIN
jgi:hypothetical protein